jgi:hypothetical protein
MPNAWARHAMMIRDSFGGYSLCDCIERLDPKFHVNLRLRVFNLRALTYVSFSLPSLPLGDPYCYDGLQAQKHRRKNI